MKKLKTQTFIWVIIDANTLVHQTQTDVAALVSSQEKNLAAESDIIIHLKIDISNLR